MWYYCQSDHWHMWPMNFLMWKKDQCRTQEAKEYHCWNDLENVSFVDIKSAMIQNNAQVKVNVTRQ